MVLGYSNREARQIENLLREAQADVAGLLSHRLTQLRQRGYDLRPASTRRLTRLYSALDELLGSIYREAHNQTRERLLQLASGEAEFARNLLATTVPIEVGTALPSGTTLRSVVVSRPFQGRHLREWFTSLEQAQKKNLRQAVRLGIAEGESIDRITERVLGTRGAQFTDGALDVGRRQARAVVRTAVNHVSNHAREALYENMGNLISGVQIVATLDGRTTPICRGLDGQVSPLGQGGRPPFHVNCRTTTVPVTRSARELGLGNFDSLPVSTRASMNGQVAGNLRYDQWFRDQSVAFQREVLGPNRHRMFQAGLTDIRRFADRNGRLYTLPELYRREATIAQAANTV